MPHKKRTSTSYLKKPLSILLFSALLVSTTYISPTGATTSHSWSTTTDFSNGTFTNTASTLPDSVSLSLLGTPIVDSTYDDFTQGYTLPGAYPHVVTHDGNVTLGYWWSYTTDTTPALPADHGDLVNHSHLSGDLLYVSTHSGLSVIDTKGTPDTSDDTLLFTYSTTSTPAIAGNSVQHSHLSGDLLYVGTWQGGLSVIDTKGTPDPSDDTLLFTYGAYSTPVISRIASDNVFHSHLSDDLLYVSTSWGLSVIDTKGTLDPADDMRLITYNAHSTPAIASSYVTHSQLSDNLLYVSTGGGLSVIDTKGTPELGDDLLLFTYTSSSTPAIGDGVTHSHLAGNLLYVSSSNYFVVGTSGLSVIDTKGTPDPADDELVITYSTTSTPAILSNGVQYSHLEGHLLYVSTQGGGLSVIDLSENYNPTTSFLSTVHPITTTPSRFTLNSLTPSDTSVSLQYRTGTSEALWQDEFDDGNTSNVSDLYAWGAPFNTVQEIDGVLTLSNPETLPSPEDDYWWGSMWIDTDMGTNFFPAGSVITAKVRANTSATGYATWMFTDEWEDQNHVEFVTTNEWVYLTLIPTLPFSSVGFYPDLVGPASETWQPEDTLEIDYVRITTEDWNPWSTPCTLETCPINQADLVDANIIQYRLDLATSDPSVTPSVNSVTLAYDYETTGTYTSNTLTFPQTTDLLSFSADTTIPTGTTLTFEYSTDGTTWLPLSEGASLPSSTTTFTWRALLTTTDPSLSPLIHSVDLTYSPTAKSSRSSTTSVALQIANLTDQGKLEEASLLEEKFPSVSDNLNDITIRQEIIRLLRQIIALLERVAEMQRGQ